MPKMSPFPPQPKHLPRPSPFPPPPPNWGRYLRHMDLRHFPSLSKLRSRYDLRERASDASESIDQPSDETLNTPSISTERFTGEFRVGKPWQTECDGFKVPYFAPTAEAVEIIFQHHATDSCDERVSYEVNVNTDVEPLFHIGDKVYTRTVPRLSRDETDEDDSVDDDDDSVDDDDDSVDDDDGSVDEDEIVDEDEVAENDEAVDNDGGDDRVSIAGDDESTESEQAFEILEIHKGHEIFHLLSSSSQAVQTQSDDEDVELDGALRAERRRGQPHKFTKSEDFDVLCTQSESESDDDDATPYPYWTNMRNDWFYRLHMSDSIKQPVPLVAFWHESQLEFAPLATDCLSESEDDEEILTDIPVNDNSDYRSIGNRDTEMRGPVTRPDALADLADIPSAQASAVIVIEDEDDAEQELLSGGGVMERVKKQIVSDTGLPDIAHINYPSLPNSNLENTTTDEQDINSAQAQLGEKRHAEAGNIEKETDSHSAKRRRFWNW